MQKPSHPSHPSHPFQANCDDLVTKMYQAYIASGGAYQQETQVGGGLKLTLTLEGTQAEMPLPKPWYRVTFKWLKNATPTQKKPEGQSKNNRKPFVGWVIIVGVIIWLVIQVKSIGPIKQPKSSTPSNPNQKTQGPVPIEKQATAALKALESPKGKTTRPLTEAKPKKKNRKWGCCLPLLLVLLVALILGGLGMTGFWQQKSIPSQPAKAVTGPDLCQQNQMVKAMTVAEKPTLEVLNVPNAPARFKCAFTVKSLDAYMLPAGNPKQIVFAVSVRGDFDRAYQAQQKGDPNWTSWTTIDVVPGERYITPHAPHEMDFVVVLERNPKENQAEKVLQFVKDYVPQELRERVFLV